MQKQVCMDGTRGYSLTPLLKGVYDGVMGAIEIGGWITGRQSLPLRSRLERTGDVQSRSTNHSISRKYQTSASSQSWHVSFPRAPSTDPDAETTLTEQLRSVLRLLSNPAVICTANHHGIPRAMTMSSFTSLTLSPTPLVSFNIATPSRTLDAISASQEFNIHILAGDASGAAVADHFTKGNMDGMFDNIEGATCMMDPSKDRASPPMITGQGVLRVLRCRLLKDEAMGGLIRVKDHVIVVGEVVEIIPVTKLKGFGLAYADRKYRQVGGVIEEER
ncbi:hypothetical protein QQS21_012010 [Conoideocrella luteorostrata]|uniref:Flavin reductase like domain-containing protein n=1 Tax=Conoideocrella luteorostrata TaxID=1105319 RepID=A0AAJ0CGJ7_9HYPO|nr:hypothetical protein QQS21_012010 [Conoideocrella luteorostrata]